jgi:hypothetical protein
LRKPYKEEISKMPFSKSRKLISWNINPTMEVMVKKSQAKWKRRK